MPNFIRTVYLDLDGVLADFCRQASLVHRLTYGEMDKRFADPTTPPCWWNGTKFWEPINEQSEWFWVSMPMTVWAREVFAFVLDWTRWNGADLHILTAPSLHSSSYGGKAAWVRAMLGPQALDNTIMTRFKYRLANNWALLIDDSPKQVEEFREHEGNAILFPNRFNDQRNVIEAPNAYLEEFQVGLEEGRLPEVTAVLHYLANHLERFS
jgi:hypothetical protein